MICSNLIPPGSIVYGHRGNPLTVLEDRGQTLVVKSGDRQGTVDRTKIERWQYGGFYLGDRVTIADKYQVRAADVGTVESITDKGIQVLWDNKSPYEPNLKQPPKLFRTFPPEDLELIESKYLQN